MKTQNLMFGVLFVSAVMGVSPVRAGVDSLDVKRTQLQLIQAKLDHAQAQQNGRWLIEGLSGVGTLGGAFLTVACSAGTIASVVTGGPGIHKAVAASAGLTLASGTVFVSNTCKMIASQKQIDLLKAEVAAKIAALSRAEVPAAESVENVNRRTILDLNYPQESEQHQAQ